jgi:hypothetical protein
MCRRLSFGLLTAVLLAGAWTSASSAQGRSATLLASATVNGSISLSSEPTSADLTSGGADSGVVLRIGGGAPHVVRVIAVPSFASAASRGPRTTASASPVAHLRVLLYFVSIVN